MRNFCFVLWGIIISSLIFSVALAENIVWKEQKGNHFVVYYEDSVSDSWISDVLRESERYYDQIAEQIGYARYGGFWTWEDRVKVYIYADRDSFIKETGLPEWSAGASVRDLQLHNERIIASYHQEESFLDGVLPHEIAHLILRDFLSGQSIPLWFDEGMAQLQENKKRKIARKAMPLLVKQDQQYLLKDLVELNIRQETDSKRVMVFYLQSMSLLDFLINKYGNFKFRELCLQMKNGASFEQALKSVYSPHIDSLNEFEKKWLSYMKSL